MDIYRIKQAAEGWSLYRDNSLRPLHTAHHCQELVALARTLVTARGISLRIEDEQGFREIRLAPDT